jgi:PBSX family phage terminase large subunit
MKTKDYKLKVTRLFKETLKATTKVVINRGGAGSGKTISVLQVLIHKFLNEKNKKILIVRKTLPSLRSSAYADFIKILEKLGIMGQIEESKQFLVYKYGSNEIRFASIDDSEKVKCFVPETEVFTDNGFVNVKDLKEGDKVASLNPLTNDVIFVPVTKKWKYNYNGYVYSPKYNKRQTYLDFCVTEEHKLLASQVKHTTNGKYIKQPLKFYKVSDKLRSRLYVPRTGNYSGKIQKTFEIPKTSNGRKFLKLDMECFLRFLGWYISEGSISGDTTISISQKSKETKKLLKQDLEKLGYGYSEYNGTFTICGKELRNYLLNNCGRYSYKKKIPRDILNLHPSLLINLFETLILGDGTQVGENSFVYYTSSKQLADDVSELAIKLGYVPTLQDKTEYVKNNKDKYYPNAKSYYAVSITKQDYTVLPELQKTWYNGVVYCYEVLPFHTTLIRYKGRVQWIGQSTNYNYIFMEEATEFLYSDYLQLKLRLREPSVDGKRNQIFMNFNPIDEHHWIKEKVIDKEKSVTEIVSNYKDNPFLQKDYIEELESLVDLDVNYYRVYALGEWGKLENLIYRNWSIYEEYNGNDDECFFGIDFGFNDPMVLIEVCPSTKNKKELYIKEHIYQTGLTTGQFIALMKKIIPKNKRHRPFFCDAAEPDRILEIKMAGFNAKPAKKNVKDGIDFVKRWHLKYDPQSLNLIKESRAYSWDTDKDGNVLDVPIDFLNHTMDAVRYAIYTHMFKKRKNFIRWV